jgi:ketosteroid isomerase-like protein
VDERAVSALVRRYWDGIWRDRDLSLVDELMADPYVRHSAAGTVRMNREQLKQDFARSWELLYGAETTVDDQAVAGDRVWTRATTTGLNLQSGQRSVLTWLIVHRIEDGSFAESWSAVLPDVDWR